VLLVSPLVFMSDFSVTSARSACYRMYLDGSIDKFSFPIKMIGSRRPMSKTKSTTT